MDKTTCHGNTKLKDTYSLPRYTNCQHKVLCMCINRYKHSSFQQDILHYYSYSPALSDTMSWCNPPPPQKKSRSHLNILDAKRVTLTSSTLGPQIKRVTVQNSRQGDVATSNLCTPELGRNVMTALRIILRVVTGKLNGN